MKKLVLGNCLFVFILAALSFAQSTSDDWKGFYLGANLGGAFSGSHARTTTVFDPAGYFDPTSVQAVNTVGDQHLDLNGFTGGAQIGYNASFAERLLFGVESDFGAFRLDETTRPTGEYPCCAGSFFSTTQHIRTDWLFTARPRVGVTIAKALIYGTAGLAVTKLKYDQFFADGLDAALESGSSSANKAGWNAGGGVEFKVASHWSAKGEYLYAGFGSDSHSSTNLVTGASGAFPNNPFTQKVDLHANIVRVGVNYRF